MIRIRREREREKYIDLSTLINNLLAHDLSNYYDKESRESI